MARITVEDCIDKFPSRFELVLVASNRARKLHSGENPTVDKDNDKNTVIALREIADETLTVDQLKNDLVEEYQTTTINEEEEEEINEIEESKEEIEEDNLELDTSDEKKIMSNDADLNYEINLENYFEDLYEINQEVKTEENQYHYIDHPYFGIIVRISSV